LDFYSNTEEKMTEVIDREYKEKGYPTRQDVKRERENQSLMSREQNKEVVESEDEDSPTRSKSRSSKKRMKVKLPLVKLVLKMLSVIAVIFNFQFILNYMKEPFSTFDHTLYTVGVSVAINFVAVWILFHKHAFMRFYLSLFAILGSVGYYIYINYLGQSFLQNNLIPSILVLVTVLIAINPKVNYYLKSFVFLLMPILGIYFSGNKFALVWMLMFNAGLILFFRVSKSNKKEARTRKNKKEAASA
jgi:cation transport ATPase